LRFKRISNQMNTMLSITKPENAVATINKEGIQFAQFEDELELKRKRNRLAQRRHRQREDLFELPREHF
jgi:hypothetical protein